MSAPYLDLASKLEHAASAFAGTQLLGTSNLYTGQDSADKSSPGIWFAAAATQEEEVPYSGDWWFILEIDVFSNASVDVDGTDPETAYNVLVAKTFDAFSIDDLHVQLSANGADFTAQWFVPMGHEFKTEGDTWHNILRFKVNCCASDIPS